MLDEGQYDRASRYNLTAIIGLPGEAVDQMAEAPWWSGLVAVAPTLVYDRQASHDIETDLDWRARWARVHRAHGRLLWRSDLPLATGGRRRRCGCAIESPAPRARRPRPWPSA